MKFILTGLPTTNITQAEVFWGVPFAQAPVGSLRFEKPQAVAAYTGATPLNCTTPQNFPFCHTNYDNSILSLSGVLSIPISEDCLRLTIARPAGINCSANVSYSSGYSDNQALCEVTDKSGGNGVYTPTLVVNCQSRPTVQTSTLYVQGEYLPVNQTVFAAIGTCWQDRSQQWQNGIGP